MRRRCARTCTPTSRSWSAAGLARGCKSNDGETFNYAQHLQCEGAVEDWLNDLMFHQVAMFRNRTKNSIDSFVEDSRENWLEKFTSQHCLAANQTWWTSEVFTAFDRIEQGNENAMKDTHRAREFKPRPS